jgi:GT2 family glycosyltransferase
MTYGVVIVSWNGDSYLRECLSSVLAQEMAPMTVVVVDNASDDRSLDIVSSFERSLAVAGTALCVITERHNTGFTQAANRGLNALLTAGLVDFVLLLNQDATLDPGFAGAATRAFQHDERTGVLGAKIFLPNGLTIQHAGGFIERPRMIGRHYAHHQPDQTPEVHNQREVEFVTAAAMAIRVAALRDVGVFDEIFSPGYYEDVDLCDRMHQRSWKVVYVPTLVATHAESISFGKRDDLRGLAHRNRLFYALPNLVDPETRESFDRAERAYFRSRPPFDDLRAMGLAYLSALLGLREAMLARVRPEARTPELATALIDLLGELRRDLIEKGHHRPLPLRVARTG